MRLLQLTLFIAFFAIAGSASAVQLDWSTATWAAGSLSNSFDIDPTSPGNDVTITITGDTAQFQQSIASPNPATPAITRAFDGGLGTSPQALELALNLLNSNQSVTVTMTFSNLYLNGVSNPSFQIFDIDFANVTGSTYQDVISSITATSATGATLTPTITGVGPNVSLTGVGASQLLTGTVSTVDLGAGSDAANATISFNAPDVQSITFTYSSSSTFADPTYQHIGLFNLDYSLVPEPSPLWSLFIGAGLLLIWVRRRRTSTLR